MGLFDDIINTKEPNAVAEQNLPQQGGMFSDILNQKPSQEGDVVSSEPREITPQQEDEFVSTIKNEISSGLTPDKMSDFTLLEMYNATKGTRDVSKLLDSPNPISAMRGSPIENKQYYKQLQKNGWSDDVINYFTPPQEKSFKESFIQTVPQMILPTLASTGTYLATKNVGYAASAAAAAEGINEFIKFNLKQAYDPASAEKTPTELMMNMTKLMALTGAADYAGGKIAKGIGSAVTPNENAMLRSGTKASDSLEAGYKKAVQVMPKEEVPLRSGDISDKRGIIQKAVEYIPEKLGMTGPVGRPLPSMVTRSNPLSRLENLVEDTMGGGRITKVKEELMPVASKQYVTDFADDFTNGLFSKLKSGDISPSEISDVIVDEISGSRTAWRALERRSYDAVKTQIKAIGMENTPVVDVSLAKSQAKELIKLSKRTGGVEIPKGIEGFAKNKNMKLTYSDADELDKFLRGISREYKDSQNWNDKRIVDGIENSIKSSMDDAATKMGGRVKKVHDFARKTSRDGNELFDKQLINNLDKMVDFNDASAQVVSRIFSGEDKIDSVKNILFSKIGKSPAEITRGKNTWDYLTKSYLAESLYDSVKTSPDGKLNPKAFFSRFNKIGQSAINKMYTAQQQESLKTFIDTVSMAEPIRGKDNFSFIIKSMQATAAGGSLVAGSELGALGVLLAPNLVARFITSKTGNALFTEGLQSLKTLGTVGGSYSGRLLSELYKNKQEYEKEVARHSAILKQIDYESTPEYKDLKRSRENVLGPLPLGIKPK